MPRRHSTPLRRAAAVIDRWDVAASNAVARAEFPAALDRGLPLLTWAADKSKLWLGLSGVMIASGNEPARRAAARGLSSIAVASLLANQVGKRALSRRRPDLDNVPIRRIARHVPIRVRSRPVIRPSRRRSRWQRPSNARHSPSQWVCLQVR